MKKIFTVAIVACLILSACTKDSNNERLGIPKGALLLTSESFKGHTTKNAVNNTTVQWVNGDKVYINGAEYDVTVAGGKAYVSVPDESEIRTGEAYAYTGVLGTPTWNSGTKQLTVNVPNEYTSSYDGNGRQIIDLPMVAYNPSAGNYLEFRHITAALKVRIKNNTGQSVYLDKVVVRSSNMKLCYSVAVPLNKIDDFSVPSVNTSEGERQVSVLFPFNTVVINQYSSDADIKEVQVPILPTSSTSSFTVEVYTHKMVDHSLDNSGLLSVSYSYNFSATNSVPILDRNVMITAGVNVQTAAASPSTMTELDHSKFTVAPGKQVRFSKGNLQCTKTGSTWADGYSWSFMDHQYSTVEIFGQNVGTNNANISTISLFGWGTSGYHNAGDEYNTQYFPYATSTSTVNFTNNKYGYGPSINQTDGDLKGTSANYDWGVFNSNGLDGDSWRVCSIAEWDSLFTERLVLNQSGIGNIRYTKAYLMSSVQGVILFPDSYLHPCGVPKPEGVNNASASWNQNKYTEEQWAQMEKSGAVFLPAAGFRNGTTISNVMGSYWSGGHKNAQDSYRLLFNASSLSSSNSYIDRYYGCSVRLVQDVR